MSSQDKPDTAFALSLIGGILMVMGGSITSIWFMSGGLGFLGTMRGFGGSMMGGFPGMFGSFGAHFGFMAALSIIGLVAGIVVVAASIMLNRHPADNATWGMLILAFSIISLLGMGGFLIGAIIGIVGGALALSWSSHAGS